MKMTINSIIFDFDYTLADSSKGIIECMNFAFNELGLPPKDAGEICPTIGLSLPESFQILTGNNSNSMAEQFTRLFVSRADEIMANMTVVYDTVPETLHHLKSQNKLLGIVSTKYRYRIENILDRENLLAYFNVIVGGEDVSEHKPHPESLLKAMQSLNTPASQTIYIGDSVTDAETAKRANTPFVAVLSGTTQKEQFSAYHPHAILENLSEIPALLSVLADCGSAS